MSKALQARVDAETTEERREKESLAQHLLYEAGWRVTSATEEDEWEVMVLRRRQYVRGKEGD